MHVVATCGMVISLLAQTGPGSADPDRAGITVLRDLAYREGPSHHWRLDLAFKTTPGDKPRPAIVVIHGGGWLEGDKSSFSAEGGSVPGNILDFAALGFVAASINYRLSAEAPFPAALDDCRSAVRWLRAHAAEYRIDAGHIGAYGNSAGGHLALLLGMVGRDNSSRVQAVVSDSGPVDLLYQDRHDRLQVAVRQFLGGPPEGARITAYEQASAIHHVAPGVPPLLLIYGAADEQVPIETADRFVAALGRAGLEDVSYHRLARVDHCPYSLVRIAWLKPVVNEFFLRTLM